MELNERSAGRGRTVSPRLPKRLSGRVSRASSASLRKRRGYPRRRSEVRGKVSKATAPLPYVARGPSSKRGLERDAT